MAAGDIQHWLAIPCPNPKCKGTGYQLPIRKEDGTLIPVLCGSCHGSGKVLVRVDE